MNHRLTRSFLVFEVVLLHVINPQNSACPFWTPALTLRVEEAFVLAHAIVPNALVVFVAVLAVR